MIVGNGAFMIKQISVVVEAPLSLAGSQLHFR